MIEAIEPVVISAFGVKFSESDVARFWSKISKDGPPHPTDTTKGPCWLWMAGRQRAGYGAFMMRKKVLGAHRISYVLANGNYDETLQIQHSCDNPPCCNPDHLSIGTHADNMRDMMARGRHGSAFITHCKFGHPFSEKNTWRRREGNRVCRLCSNLRHQAWYSRKKG